MAAGRDRIIRTSPSLFHPFPALPRLAIHNKLTFPQHEVTFLPLLYEPGTAWSYSVGLDWAGEIVARANNTTLGSYMSQHIFQPLGMNSTTFHLSDRPDIATRRADMTMRTPMGLINSPTRIWSEKYKEDHGGGGLYSCPSDYVKLLTALLRKDCPLLKPESLDELFRPQLSAASKAALHYTLYESDVGPNYKPGGVGMSPMPVEEGQANYGLTGNLPKEGDVDYALGGLVNRAEIHAQGEKMGGKAEGVRRKKNAMAWGGLPNLHWVLDREEGLGMFYASQVLPPGDRPSSDTWRRFEEAVHGKDVKLEKL
jgi:CubicO group peptidase (beta-lactamase class C family)